MKGVKTLRLFYNGKCIRPISEDCAMEPKTNKILIVKYKFDCSKADLFPIFNNGFEYTFIDEHEQTVDVMGVDVETITLMTYDARPDSDGVLTTEVTVEEPVLLNADNIITRSIYSTELPTRMQFGSDTGGNDRSLSLIELLYADTSNMTSMGSMFNCCRNLIKCNTNNWDTSKVNNMSSMFANCTKLTSLDVSNFDTRNVLYMNHVFNNCTLLKSLDVSKWITNKVNTMYAMFSDCCGLDLLDVSNFDTSNVLNMGCMFDGFEDSRGKGVNVIGYENFNTDKVEVVSGLFGCNSYVEKLDLSKWDWKNVRSSTWQDIFPGDVFRGTVNLKEIKAPKNISVPLYLSDSNLLTVESLLSVINNLSVVTTPADLRLGATNLAKLTSEQIAIASNKGWNVI